jgi:hypothetical protein
MKDPCFIKRRPKPGHAVGPPPVLARGRQVPGPEAAPTPAEQDAAAEAIRKQVLQGGDAVLDQLGEYGRLWAKAKEEEARHAGGPPPAAGDRG